MDVGKIRKRIGYSQKRFATAVGLPIETIRDLEHYVIMPAPFIRQQIKDFCDKKNLDIAEYEISNIMQHLLRMYPGGQRHG